MRPALLVLAALAACATPPRVDDRSSPILAYRTFRGAVARGEVEREWECLSDELRARLGLMSRTQWEDARRIAIGPRHLLVRGITRSKDRGEPEILADGRALLDLQFPLGYQGRVVLRRVVLLRVYAPGESDPFIYAFLPGLQLGAEADGLVLRLGSDTLEDVRAVLGPDRKIDRMEACGEWFLDDFSLGDETPASVRKAIQTTKGQGP